MKEISQFTNKELGEELKAINYHIQNFSYGRWELNYRNALIEEMLKRKIELKGGID
jgi:hypothetical protein